MFPLNHCKHHRHLSRAYVFKRQGQGANIRKIHRSKRQMGERRLGGSGRDTNLAYRPKRSEQQPGAATRNLIGRNQRGLSRLSVDYHGIFRLIANRIRRDWRAASRRNRTSVAPLCRPLRWRSLQSQHPRFAVGSTDSSGPRTVRCQMIGHDRVDRALDPGCQKSRTKCRLPVRQRPRHPRCTASSALSGCALRISTLTRLDKIAVCRGQT